MQISDPTVRTIVDFLRQIGLDIRMEAIEGETFLPGIRIQPNGLLVDMEKLLYPGDLLHEAGHVATIIPEDRAKGSTNTGSDMGTEIAAQIWSYTAAVHLGLPPEIVFHENGYKGSSERLIESFRAGAVGVPLLQWMGLTTMETYPKMHKWLREAPVSEPA
ncbi:hypothetical protein [Terriglobus tenax]|uniref:hypothetical protein n=1 Tax=Terriglobus tenax TaxID=1111115 RepID=UPI0021DF84B7|nr:hypothetical protein [Terriglobus tenax]